jgi:ATP-dependent DNA helicase RecG
MPEQQTTEYKTVWKDDYLRWICGFANAQGGTLFIGMDDSGNISGVRNAQKLLVEIPNKITSILGIVADVNLHETSQGDYIEITVEPQPNPVSYKGEIIFAAEVLSRSSKAQHWINSFYKNTARDGMA